MSRRSRRQSSKSRRRYRSSTEDVFRIFKDNLASTASGKDMVEQNLCSFVGLTTIYAFTNERFLIAINAPFSHSQHDHVSDMVRKLFPNSLPNCVLSTLKFIVDDTSKETMASVCKLIEGLSTWLASTNNRVSFVLQESHIWFGMRIPAYCIASRNEFETKKKNMIARINAVSKSTI